MKTLRYYPSRILCRRRQDAEARWGTLIGLPLPPEIAARLRRAAMWGPSGAEIRSSSESRLERRLQARLPAPQGGRPQTHSHRPGRLRTGRGRPINNRPQVANLPRIAASRKPTAIGLGDYGQVAAGRLPIGRRLPTCPTSLQQSACDGIESSRREASATYRNWQLDAGEMFELAGGVAEVFGMHAGFVEQAHQEIV